MSKKSNSSFVLDFEKPLITLLQEIDKLEQSSSKDERQEVKLSINGLKEQFFELRERIYSNLEPHQRLQIARHPERPYTLDFVKDLGTNWIELHGDRSGHDDGAIVGGLLELEPGLTVVVVGNEKGRGIKEKQRCNFGMPQPSGYKKALRLFKHAENFGLPIITLIDTPGAYPGLEAEANGQSGAIAVNIQEMTNLKVPVIAIITGEGGSGGALALAVANRVLMLEHAVYSVISPEGCAAILWRTREKSADAANALKITSNDLLNLKLIDEIIPEAQGGAHNNYSQTSANIKKSILSHLGILLKMSPEELKEEKMNKFRNYGAFSE
ncbi:MAG: acetyl-CoA carboxylase carboxyltransferase subunit alpha [Candidatus Melainabacteria bacterium]|jgi:acetyl-CoA carboxylase carboxyl transferase subunit alpha